MSSWNSSPRTTIGMLPTMISQPIRASGSPFRRPASEPSQATMIRAMSWRKYRRTAASVPIWVIAVNAAPGSSQPNSLPDDPQVGAGGDRQELGEALDDPEDDGFDPAHLSRLPAGRARTGRSRRRAGTSGHPRRAACRDPPRRPGGSGAARCRSPRPPVGWPVVEQRALGRSGLVVSRLALGTMTWGRDTDEDEAAMQLTAFVDAGGTLVDTADVYCDGESERTLGHLLTDVVPRSDVLVATKAVGRTRPGPMGRGASRGHLLAALDASLERLGLDYVDLWQLHAWDEATPLEETLAACDLAVSSGRARYIGISNFTGWQTAQAATWQRAWPGRTPVVSTQVEYSLLQRGVEREVVPAAEALGAGRARLVAAGPRPAHRQVPAQHAVGVARRLAAVAGLHRRAALGDVRPDRRGGDHRRRGAGHHAAGRRAGLGARPARRRRADRRRPHRPAAAGLPRRRGRPAARGDPHRAGGRLGAAVQLSRAPAGTSDRAAASGARRRGPGLRRVLRRRAVARPGPADGGGAARRRHRLPGRRHRRPADQAPAGRPAARRAAVLQLPVRAAHLRGRRAARRRRSARRSWPPASPTRWARTPPAGCATTRGRC